jgi:hypothetical protein
MKTPTPFRLPTRLLAAALLGATLALNAGCIVAAAGAAAGAVAFVEGKLTVHIDTGYEKVVRAVEVSIPDLQFVLVSEKHDAVSAEFIARTALDKKIEVTVKREGDRSAKVEIRVGTFGDKQISMLLYDKIRSNL